MIMFFPIALLCLVVAFCCLRDVALETLAPRLVPVAGERSDGPLISVLIPARNEARRIGTCLEGLTQQTYRHFEVIVIDDESSDGTASLARSYAARLPAATVMTGAPLPPGWAGKCWACQQAAGQAHGDWLLFLDADVTPGPNLLAALVARAEQQPADMITLMPLLQLVTLAERLVLPAFMSLLYGIYPLARVSDPTVGLAFANGQCLFVRRSAYEAIGGHAAVRASLLEDVDLARWLQEAGYRIWAAAAPDLLSVRMYTGWRSLAEGLTKNALAGYRSGGTRSLLVATCQAAIAYAPTYLLVGGALATTLHPTSLIGPALLLHGAVLLVIALASIGWLVQRRYRITPAWALLFPLGLALYFALAAWAFVRIWRGSGVTWKGRWLAGQ